MPAPGTGVRGTQHDTPSAGDAAVDNVSEEFKLDLGCGLLLLARVELLGVTALPTGRRNQTRNEKMLHTRELMGAVLVAMHSRLGIGSKNPVVGRADAKRRLHQFAFANLRLPIGCQQVYSAFEKDFSKVKTTQAAAKSSALGKAIGEYVSGTAPNIPCNQSLFHSERADV